MRKERRQEKARVEQLRLEVARMEDAKQQAEQLQQVATSNCGGSKREIRNCASDGIKTCTNRLTSITSTFECLESI